MSINMENDGDQNVIVEPGNPIDGVEGATGKINEQNKTGLSFQKERLVRFGLAALGLVGVSAVVYGCYSNDGKGEDVIVTPIPTYTPTPFPTSAGITETEVPPTIEPAFTWGVEEDGILISTATPPLATATPVATEAKEEVKVSTTIDESGFVKVIIPEGFLYQENAKVEDLSEANNLNLREGPGQGNTIKGGIPSGKNIQVVAENSEGEWLYVRVADKDQELVEGWVSRDFVAIDAEDADVLAILEVPTVEATPTPVPVAKPSNSANQWNEVQSQAEEVSVNSAEYTISGDQPRFTGFPEKAEHVEIANEANGFRNTLGQGTEAYLAEPGTLWYGDLTELAIDMDVSPAEALEYIQNSNGAMQPITPDNQIPLIQEGPSQVHVPEGGWLRFFTGHSVVTFPNGSQVHMPPGEDRIYFLSVRGLYPDAQEASADRNSNLQFDSYSPGNALVMRHPGGNSNGAFMSQGQFEQQAHMALNNGSGTISPVLARNCGQSACTELISLYVDLNTGAIAKTVIIKGQDIVSSETNWQ